MDKDMTYKQLRDQFEAVDQFKKAYGMLTEDEAKQLIQNDAGNSTCKAAMYTAWQNCHEETIKNLDNFDQSLTLDGYCRLITLSLMHVMTWPEYHNNYEKASDRVEAQMHYIRQAYEEKETPNDAAAEVGFCCG